ncbi:MAG: hypothetical protein RMI56_06795 [Sulfolobales archaeon]|nr:hypothetical protein [Sulfolobales archaeon]MDW8083483.1 hypothetical protein [Sulfolobales archaeon]
MSRLEINQVRDRLVELEAVREEVISVGRDLSNLARKVVSSTLRGSRDEADRVLRDVSRVYYSLVGRVSHYPELYYSNLFYSVVAEYVESAQLYYTVFEKKFKSAGELGVHPIPYVLGTLDLIGELKRISLELLRREEYGESFRYFELAEEIYSELSELDFADSVIPGLRRKLDIYRKVLEDWRVLLIDIESRVKLERACRKAWGP